MAIEMRTENSGIPTSHFVLTDMHCGYSYSEFYMLLLQPFGESFFFAWVILLFFTSVLGIVMCRSPCRKAQNRNGLLVKSITAFHHHHRRRRRRPIRSLLFASISRKSFCVMLKLEICSFIFPLIITAYDVLLFIKIGQFIWTCF